MKKIFAMLVLSIFMMGATPIAEAHHEVAVKKAPIHANAISIDEDTSIKKVKESYTATKQKVYSLKTKVQACQGNSEECLKLKKDLRMNLKEHVLENIKLLHKYLTKSKMEFEQRDNSEGIVKRIDSYLIELEDFYEQVEKAENKEQLSKALKGYKNWIREQKNIVLGFQHKLRLNKIDTFVMRARTLENKFSTVIDRLIEEGNSPMDAKQLVEQFSSHIESAGANYKKAKSIIDSKGKATQEAIALMREAKQDLEEARTLLRGIISKLNEQGVSVSHLKTIQPTVAAL